MRASATRTTFDGFSRGLHGGLRRHGTRRRRPRCRRWPSATRPRVEEVTPSQHFTQPPPRYTEASLIKALEERGIGRPSTYAATISTIIDRGYVTVVERRLRPEPVGEVVTDLLVEHFGEFVDYDFTARMEDDLDEIAEGERDWVALLREFYDPFVGLVDTKRKELKRSDFTTEETDEVCSEGHPMVIRLGRNGRFLACSLYPEHRETRPLPGEEAEMPPSRASARSVRNAAREPWLPSAADLAPFAGCSRYPDCKYIRKTGPPPPEPLPFDVTCPKCGEGLLAARRARRTGSVFWGCSRYPKCDFTSSREPLGPLHDTDDGPVAREGESGAICLKCGASINLPESYVPGQKLSGGEPNPEALVSSRRTGRGRGQGTHETRLDNETQLINDETHPARRVTGAEALEAFLGRLAARDSSENTRRAYRTAIGQYLEFLDTGSTRLAETRTRRCSRVPGRADRSRPFEALNQQPTGGAALVLPIRVTRRPR